MSDTYEPRELFVIDNVDALKAISDEKRVQMLALLVQQPATVKQIAMALEMAANKLYYHIKLLEEHDLIRVVDTQVVSSIIEKTYRATALRYTIAEELIPVSGKVTSATTGLILQVLNQARQDFQRLRERDLGDLPMAAVGEDLRLTPQQAKDLRQRLDHVIDEFLAQQQTPPPDDAVTCRLLYLLYPASPDDST